MKEMQQFSFKQHIWVFARQRKNWQICPSFELLKAKKAFSFKGLCPWTPLVALHSPWAPPPNVTTKFTPMTTIPLSPH